MHTEQIGSLGAQIESSGRGKARLRVIATLLLLLAGAALVASFAALLVPNSVEIGPSNAVFFDCGSSLSPATHFEPGFDAGRACAAQNDQMRTVSLGIAWAASVSAVGAALLFRALLRRR
jgi:hypothetical protein